MLLNCKYDTMLKIINAWNQLGQILFWVQFFNIALMIDLLIPSNGKLFLTTILLKVDLILEIYSN